MQLTKLRGGTGSPIILMDGFLSEKNTNEKSWMIEVNKINHSSPVFYLSWKSKKEGDIFKYATIGAQVTRATPVGFAVNLAASAAYNWREAKRNAHEAGIFLADLLADLGQQSFILCGHSLGARVIYQALSHLKSLKKTNLVKNVHLLGGAISHKYCWDECLSVVEDKIYNYYSKEDLTLLTIYNDLGMGDPIGRNPLNMSGVINVNVTHQVSGHTKYIPNFAQFVKTDLT